MFGIQDAFGRVLRDLRISVTDRCNFRCTYCMPAEVYGESYSFLPKEQILNFEEIARLTALFVKLGTRKIRITGGEPLVRKDLHRLIAMLSHIEGVQDLTLTTNGYLLGKQAAILKRAGLHRVTVSLDSLDDQIFRSMSGRDFSSERVLAGIRQAIQVGLCPVKINVVVQKGINDHTLVDLARHFKGTDCVVRFIEYMDVGNRNGWSMDQVIPAREIIERVTADMPVRAVGKRTPSDVAERYTYTDGSGEIGVVSSVTQPFCGECTRARLSTDGRFFTCLFAKDGKDLRGPMRSGATDEELETLIRGVWQKRTDRYSEIRTILTEEERKSPKIEMYQIGG